MTPAESLDAAITTHFEQQRHIRAQYTNRVSQAGMALECQRRAQWARTHWQDATLPDVSLQRRYTLGNIFEPAIVKMLTDSGVPVIQQQRDLSWPEFQLTGHIDGVVLIENEQIVLEIKSASRFSFEKIRKVGNATGLLMDPRAYIRGYVVQAALYALLMGLKRALVVFCSKDSGETHTIEVSLDEPAVLDVAEKALKRFEKINAAIAAKEDLPPEPGPYCKECPFLGLCAPPLSFASAGGIVEDPAAELDLTRRAELLPAHQEFEAIDERMKKRFDQAGSFILGKWTVVVRTQEKTYYDVPKDQKERFAKKRFDLRREYVAPSE